MKFILLVVGLAAGGTAAAGWLLSTPENPAAPAVPANPSSAQARIGDLKQRFKTARAEGQRAGEYTEDQLRRRLDSYRKSGTRDRT